MIDMLPIEKLTKDLKQAVLSLDVDELRLLVDNYYAIQGQRIRSENQVTAMSKTHEPHDLFKWYSNNNIQLENEIKKILQYYTLHHPIGQWLNRQMGIGPVISAGLLAYLDITKAPAAGHFWSFAGLIAKQKWEKGQKRPWCANLKVLCWKAGQGFVKVCNKENAYYGKLYKERKADEIERNDSGENEELAKIRMNEVKKTTDAYKYYSEGKLPPAHIQARAERFAVKIFISHLHEVMYEHHYGTAAPEPYAIAHLGHVHKFERPN